MADVKENKNPQGFYFNQQMCIGCRTCQVACKDKNDLEVATSFAGWKASKWGNSRSRHFPLLRGLQPLSYSGLCGSVSCWRHLHQRGRWHGAA